MGTLWSQWMDFTHGFTACYWPGPACRVDWNAWSAIGTGLGVITALAIPYLRERASRRRAGALFAVSQLAPLQKATQQVMKNIADYPVARTENEVSWAAEAMLMADRNARRILGAQMMGLEEFSITEIDMSKWPPSLNLNLANGVARAIFAVEKLSLAVREISDRDDQPASWEVLFQNMRKEQDSAFQALSRALYACDEAARGMPGGT